MGWERARGCSPTKWGLNAVLAFDLEPQLVQRATTTLPDRLSQRIFFFVADAQDLPFADSTFDAVVNFGIIHHVLDWRHCIYELGRVTRPGGMFYFEEIYPPLYANFLLKRVVRHPTEDRFYGPQFIETLEANGFRVVDGVRAILDSG